MTHLDRAGEPVSPDVWKDLFSDAAYRTVARDRVEDPDCEIETTWVGLHLGAMEPDPPRLFITELFARVPQLDASGDAVTIDGKAVTARHCVGEWWSGTEADARRRHLGATLRAAEAVAAWLRKREEKRGAV